MRHVKNIVMGLSVVAAAAACFAVSLQVGERREQVIALKRQIAADTKAVRRMQAELQIRARPNQLQRLNDAYFGLTAPTADRYFTSADAYVAFAADTSDKPEAPRVMPAIDRHEDEPALPRMQTVSFVPRDGAPVRPVVGRDVAMTLPAEPAPAATASPRAPAAPRPLAAGVQLASYAPPARPAVEHPAPAATVARSTPPVRAAAAPAPAAATLGGLDSATIASIQKAALKEGIQ